jgi:ubiquitin carboxyl-terminal hydrolase 36/42
MVAKESKVAERESALAYYSEIFPGVVHATELSEVPVWGPTPSVVAPSLAQEYSDAHHPKSQPPASAKGVCTVCFRPTTFR